MPKTVSGNLSRCNKIKPDSKVTAVTYNTFEYYQNKTGFGF